MNTKLLLWSVFALLLLSSCNVLEYGESRREIVVSITKNNALVIDSVVVDLVVDADYSRRTYRAHEFTTTVVDSVQDNITIRITVESSGKSGDVDVMYVAYSQGLPLLKRSSRFLLDAEVVAIGGEVDTLSADCLTEYAKIIQGRSLTELADKKAVLDSLFTRSIVDADGLNGSGLYSQYKNHHLHSQLNELDTTDIIRLIGDTLSSRGQLNEEILKAIFPAIVGQDSLVQHLIHNKAPTIVFNQKDTTVRVGDTLLLSTVVTDDESIVRYEWDFDGDSIYEITNENNLLYKKVFWESGILPISFRAVDSRNLSGVAMVTVRVNTPPVVTVDTLVINENVQGEIATISVDDIDGDAVNFILDSQLFSVDSVGMIRSLMPFDFEGVKPVPFSIGVYDALDTTYKDIVIRVVNQNDNAPIFNALPAGFVLEIDEDASKELVLSGGDIDGNQLKWSYFGAMIGEVSGISGSGTIKSVTYGGLHNQYGVDTLSVILTDDVYFDTLRIPVVINEVNDNPIISNKPEQVIAVSHVAGASPIWSAVATDVDDPDGLTWSVLAEPKEGLASVAADGVVTYTPQGGYQGLDSLKVLVTDVRSGRDTATVYLNIE
ncbi:MAG: Ig-like domain-containing protein [Fibrobacterales bacterium]